MKRILAISLATLLLNIGALGTSAQAVERPACADINGNSGNSYYQVDAPGDPAHEAILSIRITTVDPLCKWATLTVYLSTDGTTFTAQTYPGGAGFSSCGANCLTFTQSYGSTATAPSSAPAVIYVYIETAFGKHVVDRAPNSLAAPFALCDHDITTADYHSDGTLIAECTPPGDEAFE